MLCENERQRVVVDGRRCDDHARCELLVVHEGDGTWVLYLDDVSTGGVRLSKAAAEALARAIVADS